MFFFFQAEDGIRAKLVPGVQTCALRSPTPLDLTPPEDVTTMNIDSAGNFVCGSGSATWRSLPVWAADPTTLCQQQQQQQQQQLQQQQQQQQVQQDSDGKGVAGWIKDMFGQ